MTDTTPSDSSPTSDATGGLIDSDPTEQAPTDADGAPDSSGRASSSGSGTSHTDSSAAKDPSDWVTGDEAMTGPQKSYLGTLAREAGEQLPEDLTKAEASEQIDRLQQETGRGA
jgi:hypothetical protein